VLPSTAAYSWGKAIPMTRSRFLGNAATAAAVSLASPHIVNSAVTTTPRYLDEDVMLEYIDQNGVSRSGRFLVRRFTGDSTPFKFPVTPIRLEEEWPQEIPFDKDDFARLDENDDTEFYSFPRLVYHIDEGAVAALTQYYRRNIPSKSDILDICSSWVSHYPVEFPGKMGRISGTGINAVELKANNQLNDWQVRNLNINPALPYDDNSFDVVTCVVSIDYLIRPIEVLKEVKRVLRPGGKVIISQSNRFFFTKAVQMWTEMNDRQHLELIDGYFQYAGGFKPRKAFDISAKGSGVKDPMFIIEAQLE